jgi:hypothetical protein
VPSRTRFQREHLLEVGVLVGDELSIDGVGDPALKPGSTDDLEGLSVP